MAQLARFARVLAGSLLAASLMLPAHAAERLQLVEQQIEAGLIYNFLRYTQWPAGPAGSATAPIVVCLLGGDPFAGHLQPMAGRTVNQRSIEIKTLSTIEETQPCALVFVNSDEMSRWPELRAALATKPMLTVSDYEGFADQGGMIEFTRVNSRVGVKINTDAVTAAKLRVEDRLLRLATPASAGGGR